jgi:DNA-binding FrmR family transcriptional regulator
MTHTVREKQKLLNRARRIRGQADAIVRALEGEKGCEQVMHLIAGCRGAINGLLAEVVEDHILTHSSIETKTAKGWIPMTGPHEVARVGC